MNVVIHRRRSWCRRRSPTGVVRCTLAPPKRSPWPRAKQVRTLRGSRPASHVPRDAVVPRNTRRSAFRSQCGWAKWRSDCSTRRVGRLRREVLRRSTSPKAETCREMLVGVLEAPGHQRIRKGTFPLPNPAIGTSAPDASRGDTSRIAEFAGRCAILGRPRSPETGRCAW